MLAKFILVGHAMKIGQRILGRPLIWPTIHMAFAFLVVLIPYFAVLVLGETLGGIDWQGCSSSTPHRNGCGDQVEFLKQWLSGNQVTEAAGCREKTAATPR